MRRRPKLTDRTTLTREQARYYTAVLHRLAEHRYSMTLLAERLEITYHQVRHLCRGAGIDTSKPLITRPGAGGRPRKPKPVTEPKPVVVKEPRKPRKRVSVGPCGLCGNPDVPLTPGERLGPHNRLGPRVRGVAVAVPCPGAGDWPTKTDEGANA